MINGWADGYGYGNNQLIDCGKRVDQYVIGSVLMVSDCLAYIGEFTSQDAPNNPNALSSQVSTNVNAISN